MNRTLSTKQVWEQFSDRLFRFLRARVSSEDLASDLLQETFLRVHSGLSSLKDEDRILAWVHRIARNVISDHRRSQANRDKLEENLASESLVRDEDSDTNYNGDVALWLKGIVDSLPGRYREAVRLSEIEGLSQKNVAERLGISYSGAKSRVQRGRELIRALFAECCDAYVDSRGNVVDCEKQDGRECEC